MRILLVEDHLEMAEMVAEVLREACYAVDVAGTAEQASDLASSEDYDLVVMDWELPEGSGLTLVREWREGGLGMPILMLTVRHDDGDIVRSLDAGADDHLPKPFAVEVLLARIRSLIRRRKKPLFSNLRAGDLVLNRARQVLEIGGRPVILTPKEFAMLEYLLRHTDEVVTRSDLGSHVWDSAFDPFSNVVDVTVHRLRKKIDVNGNGTLLQTVRGMGYMLQSERS